MRSLDSSLGRVPNEIAAAMKVEIHLAKGRKQFIEKINAFVEKIVTLTSSLITRSS